MTVTISVSQSEYEHFTRCKDAIEWVAENCSVDYWYDGHVAGCWDAGDDNPLLNWVTAQQEPDHEPDYGATTAGESMDAARVAAREAGR